MELSVLCLILIGISLCFALIQILQFKIYSTHIKIFLFHFKFTDIFNQENILHFKINFIATQRVDVVSLLTCYLDELYTLIRAHALIFFLFFLAFCLHSAALAAYGGSQARGLIGAVAAGLRHSHSNAGSEPRL